MVIDSMSGNAASRSVVVPPKRWRGSRTIAVDPPLVAPLVGIENLGLSVNPVGSLSAERDTKAEQYGAADEAHARLYLLQDVSGLHQAYGGKDNCQSES